MAKVVLLINIIFLICCTNTNNQMECYKIKDIKIIDTYLDTASKNYSIVYSTKLETIYYSSGVVVSMSDKNANSIYVSFLRNKINDEIDSIKLKSVFGKNLKVPATLKDKLNYSPNDNVVCIPINQITKGIICKEYTELKLE